MSNYPPEENQEPSWPIDGNPNLPDEVYQADIPEEKTHPHTIFKPRLKKPSFALSVLVNAVRVFALLIVLVGLAGAGAVLGIAKAYVETSPTLDLTLLDDQDQTSFIYDAAGNLITDYKGTEDRVMVSIDTMPTFLQNAFVAVEDARFYTHNGIDVKRIIGAFVKNATSSTNQGGSTITQQLIKNTVLSDEQSYKRKIQEAYLAMQLETQYTKEQILEYYLNTIYLGENYYGVYVASQGYFGKDPADLTLRECAMLAGLTQNPYYYNPRRNYYIRTSDTVDYAAITNDRTNYVLRCMYENQFITRQQYEEALNPATANVLTTEPGSSMYEYAHFVEYAITEVVDIFLEMDGLANTTANRYLMENKLRTGGYSVYLTIDTSIQTTVEETLENWTKYPSLNDPSDKIYKARKSDGTYDEIIQPQAAAVVLDYRTGELKAIVGSRNRPTAKKTLNRATDMNMPVGSSIKPISVYAEALELGASPASIAYNLPVPISGWRDDSGKDSWPKNYGGSSYNGAETLRAAMMRSHNTAAAYTLLTYGSVDTSVSYLKAMGVAEKNINATPFGISLGSSGITPMQMSVAYGVLANGGVYQEPISVMGICDATGAVIWDGHAHQESYRVFKASTAWMIVDMMKSVISSGTGTNAKISGQTVAGKTGTNSDQKGVTFCGMTGYYVSALWIGHDNYKALSSKTTGSSAAAPLWKEYMTTIHQGLANKDILDYSPSDCGLVKVTTCTVSGQLATDACKNDAKGFGTTTDYWLDGTQPTTYCQMHKTVTLCTESGKLATSFCPSTSTSAKGVITIPEGHPLYRYIGTQYQSVLTEYFGSFAANTSGDLAAMTCTMHTAYSTTGQDSLVTNTLLPDAQTLLASAQTLLNSVPYGSDGYNNLASAISYLQGVINSSPTTSILTDAMSRLTQAMANAN